jgi:FKBP-type peptidyl-prolyl cis-trans isomerase FkpA
MSEVTAVPIRPLARGTMLKLWLALAVLIAAAVGVAWIGTSAMQVTITPSGLRYQVVSEGTGPTVQQADLVRLHYVGRANGTIFDSSVSRGQPMETGVTGIIPGLGEALLLMRKGGKYRLWIPPQLAYGSQVPPGAPFGPNDTLQFEIEVIDVMPGLAAAQQMEQMRQLQEMMRSQGNAPEGAGTAPGAGPPGAAPPPPGAGPPGAGPPSGR